MGHVACMAEIRKVHKILVGKPKEKETSVEWQVQVDTLKQKIVIFDIVADGTCLEDWKILRAM